MIRHDSAGAPFHDVVAWGQFFLSAGEGPRWWFTRGLSFWPRLPGAGDGDLLVDLVVDLIRRRNLKPTLCARMEVARCCSDLPPDRHSRFAPMGSPVRTTAELVIKAQLDL